MSVTIVGCGPVRVAWAAGADARAHVLQALLADAGTPDDTVVRACAHCGSTAHGAPRSASGRTVLSISHAGELTVAAAAMADAAASVGADVEPDRGDAPLADLAPLFAPRTPPTVREWTAIEAAVKADGRGLRIPPGDVELAGDEVRIPGREPFVLLTPPAPAGYVISVAIDPGPPTRPARESDR